MGKSPDTIYTWLKQGRIKGTRVGRFVFFTKADIKEILDQMRQKINERPQAVREQFQLDNDSISSLLDSKDKL